MKRVFRKYTEWEDYQNGMYESHNLDDEELLLGKSVLLLTDDKLFLDTCKNVIDSWKITSSVHLTNNTINKKAWIGQASCSYLHKSPERLTRVAWGRLSKKQQETANRIAETVINSYIYNLKNGNNIKLHL